MGNSGARWCVYQVAAKVTMVDIHSLAAARDSIGVGDVVEASVVSDRVLGDCCIGIGTFSGPDGAGFEDCSGEYAPAASLEFASLIV